jgi:Tfp pilus assembly protein PilZ
MAEGKEHVLHGLTQGQDYVLKLLSTGDWILRDEPQRYPVAGRVAWITPARASGNRTQGIGIQFPKDEKSAELRAKIENILGTALGSDKATQTV